MMRTERLLPPLLEKGAALLLAASLETFLISLGAPRAGAQSGGVDVSFDPGTGASANVWAVASQPDGRVVIGGAFTSVNGMPRNRIARLNPDGSVDTSFNPGTGVDSDVQVIRLDASGRILIGGFFTSVNGTNRNRIARLNGNGGLDLTFNPGSGASAPVWALAVQTDGRIVIGGEFTSFNSSARNGIVRLSSSGALDDAFVTGTGFTNAVPTDGPMAVYALGLQADGRILTGGRFTSYSGTARTNIARLNSTGTMDGTFNPGTGAGSDVTTIGIQSDGRIILGGSFASFNGDSSRRFVTRLNTNGSLDLAFNVGNDPDNKVENLLVLPDNRILIGGDFETIGGMPRRYLARLEANGMLDPTFDAGTSWNEAVVSLAAQADGRVVVGGYFTLINGVPRNRIARVHGRAEGLSPRLVGAKNPGNYSISFLSLTNTAYLLEYTDSLSVPVWIPLAMVFGDGATRTLSDPSPNARQRFYRLRVLTSQPYLINSRKSANTFQVSLPAYAWKTYVLEYKNSLNDALWTPLPGVTGDNSVKTLSDTSATVPSRFYRVRAQ